MSTVAIPLRGWYFADPARLEPVKWLAVLAMICDHLAVTVLPTHQWLRLVGTFAFPAFALSFGDGLAASSDPLRVLRRLWAPALVAQASWFVIHNAHPLNVLCVFAACALVPLALGARLWLWCAVGVVAVALFSWFGAEGGASGFALVLAGYLAARGSWYVLALLVAAWMLAMPSWGFAAGVACVVCWPRTSLVVPRVPGLLAWVYAGHLWLLASWLSFGGPTL